MQATPTYFVAGTGAITALGGDSQLVYHAVRAGLSGYASADYFTRRRERISMALVPDEALPPLCDELDIRGKLSFRDGRLLRMCHAAAAQALNNYHGARPVPMILSVPANDFGLAESLCPQFIHYLVQQSGLPIDPAISRLIGTGRTGVLEALGFAMRYLYDTDYDEVLIGGADSYQHSDLLAALDKDDRLLAPGVMNGFVPGEGAGFILLTRKPTNALRSGGRIPALFPPGIAHESGYFYGGEPYRGDGLAHAFNQALQHAEGAGQIQQVYSSMNGEHYWAKEYGVAMTRNQEFFSETCQHHHPAEGYGDLGAATGALLILLATYAQLNSRTLPTASLIYCSSDRANRAAACLLPILMSDLPSQPIAPNATAMQPRKVTA